jgi:phage-related protein (TIGR01555 family)
MQLIGDTLSSLASGMGTNIDKAMSLFWTMRAMDRANLDAAYRGDWIARKVVDIPPNDATREWRAWQAEDEQIQAIENTERRLGVRAKVRRAMQLGRLYGGAALLIGDGAADPGKPFDPDAVAKGGIRYLHVFPRWRLGTSELEWDPESPFFGTPALYQIPIGRDRQQIQIHPSRVIQFIGQPTPDPFDDGQQGWGDSILQSVGDAVRQAGLAAQTIASLLTEAKTDSIGIPNLFTHLTTSEGEAAVRKRYALAAEMKSLYQTVVRDALEVWDTRQVNFAQLPDILREYLQIAAGAADIPATRLLGQSPAGLNATGDGDIRNYYDMIASMQANDLAPNLARLDEALIRDALGDRPDEVHYQWAPLWQPSEAERATVALQKAQATQIYAINDLLPPAVLAKVVPNQLTEDGTYPGIEAAMADYEAGLLEEPDWQEPDAPAVDPEADPAASKIDPATGKPIGDAAPRTLYVSRPVVNAVDIAAWAKAQGITDLLPDLHVTIAASRTQIDWMKIDGDWNSNDKGDVTVAPGGVRIVEPLGGMTAVLLFTSSVLTWRHEQIMRAGATNEYPDFQPHISLTKATVDLAGVEPYRGKIVLGPERFDQFKDDPAPGETQDGGGPTGRMPFRRGQAPRTPRAKR